MINPFLRIKKMQEIGNELIAKKKSVVLWLLEGQVLSRSELLSLCEICESEPRLKIVVEMGGSRTLTWQSMRAFLN